MFLDGIGLVLGMLNQGNRFTSRTTNHVLILEKRRERERERERERPRERFTDLRPLVAIGSLL